MILNETVQVLSNEKLDDTLFLMRLHAQKIAQAILPGQFVHLELPDMDSHILRRPFSVYDADSNNGDIDILYQVVGAGTSRMTIWEAGFETTMMGPIGHAWNVPEGIRHALLVGGGVGAAPLFMLAKQLEDEGSKVDVILGATTKSSLVCKDRYDDLCKNPVSYATDDGSFGAHGFCTVCVERALNAAEEEGFCYDYAAICGPEPMMRATVKLTSSKSIPTQVSLEARMACGVGACLSCTCDTPSGKKRACVDGPIFSVEELGW